MRLTIEQIRDEISDRLEYVGAWLTSKTDRRTRWIGSSVIVFGLHLVFFWILIISNTQEMRLPTYEDEAFRVELYEIPLPPPEPRIKPEPQVRLEETPVEQTVPQEEIELTTPTEETAVQPIPDTLTETTRGPPRVIESPRPSLTVKPVELPELAQRPTPTVSQQTRRDVQLSTQQAPSLVSPNLGVRKPKEDEQIAARRNESVRSNSPSRDVTSLNLHTPDRIAPNAPTSGLTPSRAAGSSGSSGGGGAPAGGLPPGSLPGSLQGLTGGRSGVSQALQNHNSCVELQRTGKPIPDSCDMEAMASMTALGPKPDADFQRAAAQRDANQRYKTSPGSTEYWQRVNRTPTPGSAGRDDGLPRKGEYSDPKDARVMNGDGIDPINEH